MLKKRQAEKQASCSNCKNVYWSYLDFKTQMVSQPCDYNRRRRSKDTQLLNSVPCCLGPFFSFPGIRIPLYTLPSHKQFLLPCFPLWLPNFITCSFRCVTEALGAKDSAAVGVIFLIKPPFFVPLPATKEASSFRSSPVQNNMQKQSLSP